MTQIDRTFRAPTETGNHPISPRHPKRVPVEKPAPVRAAILIPHSEGRWFTPSTSRQVSAKPVCLKLSGGGTKRGHR